MEKVGGAFLQKEGEGEVEGDLLQGVRGIDAPGYSRECCVRCGIK